MPAVPSPGAPQSPAPNSKRFSTMAPSQSLNHLLNFSLPPRQTHQYSSAPRRRKPSTHAAMWNKERFVNAQYRFVMNPSGDYTVHFADPDIFFQWPDILQVIIPRTSAAATAAGSRENGSHEEGITTCPICLSPPTAPRMTKCGHVFCYPCILHYLNISETHKWVKCPICTDSVHERELKAVKWIDPPAIEDDDEAIPAASSSSSVTDSPFGPTPRTGSTLRMRLMQRPQITTLALPRSTTWPSDLLPSHQAPFHFLPDVYTFSKFMLATPSSLIADLTHDLDELAMERSMLASMKDDLGVLFVDSADAKVRQQMAKAAALETPQLKQAVDAAHHSLEHLQERAVQHTRRVTEDPNNAAPLDDAPDAFLALQSSGGQVQLSHPVADSQAPGRNPRQRRNVNPPPPTSSYYYYQAASGMPVFLHPLDIKILLSHFHNYPAFPNSITVRVESHTESTVNEDLRKRCKYLSHLPEGADVVFVEADLEGVVGQDGLKQFERALSLRRAKRKEKVRKDDKARSRAEEREKERLVSNWNEMTRHRVDAYIAPPVPREASPSPLDDINDFPEPGRERVPVPEPERPQEAAGAWGSRSFASAAHHPASGARIVPQSRPAQQSDRDNQQDEWDLDLAFHALEQRAVGRGGGKRKNNRMVVLGGGGGRRR